MASGADQAPRSWARNPAEAGRFTRSYYATGAVQDLMCLRVLRPSCHYLLNSPSTTLCRNFTAVNDPDGFGRLRSPRALADGTRWRPARTQCALPTD